MFDPIFSSCEFECAKSGIWTPVNNHRVVSEEMDMNVACCF